MHTVDRHSFEVHERNLAEAAEAIAKAKRQLELARLGLRDTKACEKRLKGETFKALAKACQPHKTTAEPSEYGLYVHVQCDRNAEWAALESRIALTGFELLSNDEREVLSFTARYKSRDGIILTVRVSLI